MKLKFPNENQARIFSKVANEAGFRVRKLRKLPVVETNHPAKLILTPEDVKRLSRWNNLEFEIL